MSTKPSSANVVGFVVGIVLAGGLSSRMGQDKAMLRWGRTTLLEHMVRLLTEAGVDRVLVSGERAGYDCIPDAAPQRGPGVALSDVLARLQPGVRALIVPIDMPLLTPDLLLSLLAHPAACFADYPLPAVLPARLADGGVLEGHSIKALHHLAGSVQLKTAPEDEVRLVNANTLDQWQRLQAAMP